MNPDDLMPGNADNGALPSEIEELAAEMRAAKNAKIEDIGKEVAKKRDEAVKGRRESGIERIWDEDEEYYQGIDDANRDHVHLLKSASTTGGISREKPKSTNRCVAFFNMTRQFVDSAAARMGDILLPAGDWNFSIKASPVQDDLQLDLARRLGVEGGTAAPVVAAAKTGSGLIASALPAPAPAPAPAPVDQPGAPAVPPAPTNTPTTAAPGQQVQTDQEQDEDPRQIEAEKAAERGENWIKDNLIECRYHSECRKVIEDAARIGTGILKGPFPKKTKKRKTVKRNGVYGLEIVEKVTPASKHVDPRDFFPDPACGDNIHNGSYVLERDRLTAKQLRNLKGSDGYLSDQIDKVLEEGPQKCHYDDGIRKSGERTKDTDQFTVWYFYGLLDVESLTMMDVELTDDEVTRDQIPAIVTMVNDTPIKAFINPLDTGEFPYDVMVWQRVPGTWTGVGVSRQGRTAQDMLNAAGRAMMDNAGLASGPMLIIRRKGIEPADGKWEITARKVWWATAQADQGRSMADVFTAIDIPMVQQELDAIMNRAEKMMEDATGISFLLQGQQGSAPDTVGGMELLHKNSSALLRREARIYDENVTEPHIGRYYEWLLMHGPEEAKGDMAIEAIGSSALVEREIQVMEAMTFLQLSKDPAYGLDPENAMEEVLKAKRYSVEKWKMDPEKKKNLPQPVVPAIEVAKIRQATDQARLALEKDRIIADHQLDVHRINVDTDRDTVYQQAMTQRDQATAQIQLRTLEIKRELALLDYANKRNITLDQIKAELAKETMRLTTQKELAAADHAVGQVETPPTEPPGKAATGHAYEQ